MNLTEQQSALRWFERQLAKLDRRLRKADEKGRIAEVEDIRVRMKAFRVAVRALKGADIHDGKRVIQRTENSVPAKNSQCI